MNLKDHFLLGHIFEGGTMCKECVREMPGGGSGIRKKSGKGEKGEKEDDLRMCHSQLVNNKKAIRTCSQVRKRYITKLSCLTGNGEKQKREEEINITWEKKTERDEKREGRKEEMSV